MNPILILSIIAGYFAILLIISHLTSRGANNQSFFIGNRQSPWYIVAIGMVGASLSGVTFISVPGWVFDSQFHYIQMVLGYLVGYTVITFVLLPVYYKLQLTSIYSYLGIRFGNVSYKTGASLFLISRIIGASFRLFLVAKVLQIVVFDTLGVPFFITVLITLGLIWVYTFRGGIKTIVWTDTLQTVFMLLAVFLTFILLTRAMDLSIPQAISKITSSGYGKVFDFSSWKSGTYFWKYFLGGAFITIVMTGLDQDMMQKNLSCKNLKDAQKNMMSYSLAFVPVNFIFMGLGALLFIFAASNGIAIPEKTDDIFPIIATQGFLPSIVGVFFILGLIAAAYSSADSALTSLTTSFLVDIIGISNDNEPKIKRKRFFVHILMSGILAAVIMFFYIFLDESVVKSLFDAATYTYGPLLGLFAFGLFTKRKVREIPVPIIAVLSPIIIYILNIYSEEWFNGYVMGFEKLIYNGVLTFLGILIFSKAASSKTRI
jgi:solute:Na+ symporter, SSS family